MMYVVVLIVVAKAFLTIGSLFSLIFFSEKLEFPEIPLVMIWLGLMIFLWL